MEDQKQEIQNDKEKDTPKESGKRDDSKVPSAVILARTENERMEANIKRMEEITSRNEELAADSELGGTAEAGAGAPIKKEETNHEYRLRVEKQMAEGTFDDRK